MFPGGSQGLLYFIFYVYIWAFDPRMAVTEREVINGCLNVPNVCKISHISCSFRSYSGLPEKNYGSPCKVKRHLVKFL